MNLRQQSGITILELLIVVAIIGILTAIGVVAFKPNHAQLAAQEFQAMMRQARFEAVRLTRPVEVVWGNRDGKLFIEAYVLEAPGEGRPFDISLEPLCEKHRVADAPITQDFLLKRNYSAGGSIEFSDPGSVYWLPNGMAYPCIKPPSGIIQPVNGLGTSIRPSPNNVKVQFVGSFDIEVVTE